MAIIFIVGWTSGWVTGQYADMFGTNSGAIPGFAKYLIWSLSGIGVLWFLHEPLLIDKKDPLHHLGGKSTMPILCLMVFAFWTSAQILNTPVIEVYRNGIYIFAFLLGYCVFSHDRVQEMLAKYAPALLGFSALLAVIYTARFWGENYASMDNLKEFMTNAYAWNTMLAVLGAGKRWMDKETKFTRYMAPRSSGFYVLHYPLLALSAWALDKLLHLPVWSMYLLLPITVAVLLPPLGQLSNGFLFYVPLYLENKSGLW